MIRKLGKNHKILCTSRRYREVVELAEIKRVKLRLVGKHGGSKKEDKLRSSVQRIDEMITTVSRFSPDLVISFCSPEAARISFGMGIKHVAFSDSPHAEAVMTLSLPFIQKLLIPWIIPKDEFVKYGIAKKDIVQYKAIDAAVIVKDKSKIIPVHLNRVKKVVVVRLEESAAAYTLGKKNISQKIIHELSKEKEKYNVLVLPRYKTQIDNIRKEFGSKVRIIRNVVDGKSLLSATDLFIGSGGTMTAEAALMGIPTISYDAVPNHIEKYLVRTGLVIRETDAKNIIQLAKKMVEQGSRNRKRAIKILNSMEDPFSKLVPIIRTI